jgi:hypothetical protein
VEVAFKSSRILASLAVWIRLINCERIVSLAIAPVS